MITRNFKLCLNAGVSQAPTINVNQYDRDEQWVFTLYNENGAVYVPSTGSIIGLKSDGHVIANAGTVSDGKVVITETEQMTAVAGNGVFELQIDGETHGTANFIVRVEKSPAEGGDYSDSDLSLFQEAIDQAERIAKYGSPLVATSASQMTNHGSVYVYTGSESGYTNGHWYYWNGSAWTDGGVYQATAVETDTTLTQSGVAADAKATGDEITDLKNAIKRKTIDLKPEMFSKYIITNVGIGNVVNTTPTDATSKHRIVPCYKGDLFYCKGIGPNNDARVWAFTDSDYKLISISEKGSVDEEIQAPSDGYAIFNFSLNSALGSSVLLLKRVLPLTNEKQIDILSELNSVDVTSKFIAGKYIKTDISPGNTVNINSPVISSKRAYFITKIRAGERVTLTGTGGGSPRLWAFLDNNSVMLRISDADITATDLELTALQDGYFIANVYVPNDYSLILHQYVALSKSNPSAESVYPFIDPSDYGVVGDGITDDTNAINDAFAAAEGKTIQFPSGTYKFSGTLVIPSNTHVIGTGQSTIFKLADTFTLSSIRHREDQDSYKYPMMRLADGAVSCTLEHFKIKGQTAAFKDESEVGLLIVGNDHIVNDVTVEDANFFPDDFAGRTSNAPAWGFMVFNAEHIRVTNCKGINCGYEAFGTEATTDCLIDNFEAGFCNQTCLQVHRNSYDITFNSCAVRYELPEGATVRPAFTMHGGSDEYDLDGIKIVNCNFYGGITFIGGYENGVSIIDNIATGGITMNAAINRKNMFIRGNRLGGGISGRFENAIITENMATNNSGGRFITVTGTNIVCAHNIPLGIGTYVAVNDVVVEQWGTNPPLT